MNESLKKLILILILILVVKRKKAHIPVTIIYYCMQNGTENWIANSTVQVWGVFFFS